MSMKKTILQAATFVSLLAGISACASQRPVLFSNEHLMRVGKAGYNFFLSARNKETRA
jgi:hypothetical protein